MDQIAVKDRLRLMPDHRGDVGDPGVIVGVRPRST